MHTRIWTSILLAICGWNLASAQDRAADQPKPIPGTRAETKAALQRLQDRQPRLPVPDNVPVVNPDPSRPASNVINGRARRFYLPEAWLKSERLGNEANALVPYELKTQCFWIVSRGNNCHYCLGHQEHKLMAAGLSDNQIAALDRDWEQLDAKTRKAVELARKMTLLPFAMTEQDIQSLRPEFTDPEIIELVYAISRFNSMNRWTDSVGLPQDHEMRGESIDFLTPTEQRWNQGPSVVAIQSSIVRPKPWNDAMAHKNAVEARDRKPGVALASVDEVRKTLELDRDAPVNDWQRAIAQLPGAGPELVHAWTAMLEDTELDPALKAAIVWRVACCNHAAVSIAMIEPRRQALRSSDTTDLALAFAEKLTCEPTRITDADIEQLRNVFSDRQTAHLIYTICVANAMDRFTETLGLSSIGLDIKQ
jgi:alkylhydroperoxidase family enzyme